MTHQLTAILGAAIMCLTTGTALAAAPAAPVNATTALEISIGGIGPAVDAKAFAKVRLLLAEALYAGTISYFDVYGYGIEGGFSACVEKGQFAREGSFERLTRALGHVRVDTSTSFYNVTPVAHCTYPQAPAEPNTAP